MRIYTIRQVDTLKKIMNKGELKSRYKLMQNPESQFHADTSWIDALPDSDVVKIRYQSVFFYNGRPSNTYAAIDVDPKEVFAGNMRLIDQPYEPGDYYGKSVMSLADFLEKAGMHKNGAKINPFTAEALDDKAAKAFDKEWTEKLRAIPWAVDIGNPFGYKLEILVPRLTIPCSEIVEVNPSQLLRMFK